MAQILGPGESMNVDEVRTDETLRFHALLQSDGNLVVYAHRIAPDIKRIAIGASDTANLGANVRLHMNPGGWLEILDTNTGARNWFRPVRFRPGTGIQPHGVPNSTLHLQADGRLVIYRPGGFSPNFATWAIAGVDQPTEDVCVMPGTLIIDVSDSGSIAPQFDKQFVNDSPETVGVRDGQTFVAVPPGGQVGIATPGTIVIAAISYSFPSSGAQGSADAIPTSGKTYGPAENVIKVTENAGGFSLA
jgi:hypothetical protein